VATRTLVHAALLNAPLLAAGCVSYGYRSLDGDFEDFEMPAKGRTFEMVRHLFDAWRVRAGEPDAVMYRTDWIPWWAPWDWHDIATHPRWDLPYLAADAPRLPVAHSEETSPASSMERLRR